MSDRTLIKLFSNPTYLDKPINKFDREDLLGDLYANSLSVAILSDKSIAIETPNYIFLAEVVEDGRIVEFDALSRDRVMIRYNFWMNVSSVKDLGNKLRKLPRKTFEELLTLPDKN